MVKRICLALVIAVFARTASADSAPANGCAMYLPFVWDLAGSVSLAEPYAASLHRGGATRVWGTQNVRVEGSGSDAVIAVTYPEGSIDPASAPGAPLGGAGFQCTRSPSSSRMGGRMSYGVPIELRAVDYIDRILRGTIPSSLPVQQPNKFEFLVDLKTAKAVGLTIPQTLLAAAKEVIE